jgi:hypothetical protein
MSTKLSIEDFPMTLSRGLLWLVFVVALLAYEVQAGPSAYRLTSEPAPLPVPSAVKAAVGQDFTGANEHRRFVLGENATLLLKQGSTAKYSAPGVISLSAGEVYADAKNLTIETGQRQVRIKDGKVAVRVDKSGTSVYVTRGEAVVAGATIGAGWQLLAEAKGPAPMPRASHLLDWAKDLLAADMLLVPKSQFEGGALVAKDPDGQEAKISLRKFHVDVYIEDGFARTTIDQTYFNQERVQLEGTFYFPLPPDASLSRLAMYVNGRLMEGGMAERNYARDVYESIRYTSRDPALLEWVDGSTFKMRVFPLEPRTEKRIVLSYTQRLPSLYGKTSYRFPAGHSLKKVDKWKFQAHIQGGAKLAWECTSHRLDKRLEGPNLVLTGSAENASTARDVSLSFTEPYDATTPRPRFNSAKIDGADYFMVRYHPTFPSANQESTIKNRLWLFLCESSGDRDPLLARAQIEIIRNLLNNIDSGDQFLVATAGTRVKLHAAMPQVASPANIDAALRFLEESHLIGAVDLDNALEEVSKHAKGETYLVHVGSGIAAMGERRDAALVQKIERAGSAKVRYVGVGVGHRWNRSFMKLAAEKTGGHFLQINPDEPIAWRAYDLYATLATPRLMNVQVQGNSGQSFLVFNQTVADGEEICAVAKLSASPRLPTTLTIRGMLDGKPVEHKVAVKEVAPRADYLPRMWAKLEIERLLAEDALKNMEAIIALSKAMYVVTPFTSLLVLEHDDLYAQYKVDRGRKDHWAIYQCPEKIPVVYEPVPGEPDPKALLSGGKQKVDYVAKTVVERKRPILLKEDSNGGTREVLEEVAELVATPRNAKPFEPVPINLGNGNLGLASRAVTATGVVPTPPSGGFPDNFAIAGVALNSQSDAIRLTAMIGPASRRVPLQRGFRDFDGAITFDGRETPIKLGNIMIMGNDVGRTLGRLFTNSGGLTPGTPANVRVEAALARFDAAVFRPEGVAVDDSPAVFNTAIFRPEDFRQAKGEWQRFWQIDQPSKMNSSRRPNFAAQDAIFFDLLTYAPGMNTSAADLQTVLEAEGLPGRASKAGKIDAASRDLLARARLDGRFAGSPKALGSRGFKGWSTRHGESRRDDTQVHQTLDFDNPDVLTSVSL